MEFNSVVENVSVEKGVKKEVGCFDINLIFEKEEKDRLCSRSYLVGKVIDLKNKKSFLYSRSRLKLFDVKLYRRNKNRYLRFYFRDRKNKRNLRLLLSFKELSYKKKFRLRLYFRKRLFKKRLKLRFKERRSK